MKKDLFSEALVRLPVGVNRIDWMSVGKSICPDEFSRQLFLGAVALVDEGNDEPHEWDKWLPPEVALPFSQGYALKSMIEGFGVHHVHGVFYSNNWMDGIMLGVRSTFKKDDGTKHTVDLIAVDRGDLLTPVCARVWEGVEK